MTDIKEELKEDAGSGLSRSKLAYVSCVAMAAAQRLMILDAKRVVPTKYAGHQGPLSGRGTS